MISQLTHQTKNLIQLLYLVDQQCLILELVKKYFLAMKIKVFLIGVKKMMLVKWQ